MSDDKKQEEQKQEEQFSSEAFTKALMVEEPEAKEDEIEEEDEGEEGEEGEEEVEDKEVEEKEEKDEEDAESSVTLDDFFKLQKKEDEVEKEKEEKKEEKKEKEEIEEKEEEEVKEEKEEKEEKLPSSRDFTGIPEEDRPLFKKMGNRAFARLKPLFIEHQQLKKELEEARKGGLPQSYYQHPDAIILSPEYKTLVDGYQTAAQIKQHWQQQLIRIKKGEKWQDLVYDKEKNMYAVGESKDASPEAEIAVSSNLQSTDAELTRVRQQAESLKETFKQNYDKAEQVIEKINQDYFKVYEDPKHPITPTRDKIQEALHPAWSKTKIGRLLANSLASNIQMWQRLQAAEKKLSAQPAMTKIRKSASPTEESIDPGKSGHSDPNENIIAQFEALRREGEV